MIAALAAAEVSTVRVIVCRVREKPRVVELAADPGGRHAGALEGLIGDRVTRLPLFDGVEIGCDRDSLFLGLALVRRILAMSLAGSWRSELRFDSSPSAYGPDLWPVSGDFLLVRVAANGELADLTEADLKLWLLWLAVDHVVNR